MRIPHHAPRRRSLFALIMKIARAADGRVLAACQTALDRLGLRYCLASPAGRCEFFADLVAAGAPLLTAAQRRAVRRCITDAAEPCTAGGPFGPFACAYLKQAFDAVPAHPATPPVGGALAAVSLAGLLVAGCVQKKQADAGLPSVHTVVLPATEQPERYYTVQPGDSVSRIAVRAGVDPAEIVRLNSLRYHQTRRWYVLHPGQVLRLPPAAAQTNPDNDVAAGHAPIELRRNPRHDATAVYHLVHKGETLGAIAKRYGVAVRDLAAANAIQDPGKIRYGTVLNIPQQSKPGTAAFKQLPPSHKVAFLAERTIPAGRPYLRTIVEECEAFGVDPRLYAALVWEESWFDRHVISQDNCRRLVQLDPRFHAVSDDVRENFQKSLRYLRHEFAYYLRKGLDRRSATICALAAYNGGTTRIRRFVNSGAWDGRDVASIPLRETKEYVARVLKRCADNYHAVL